MEHACTVRILLDGPIMEPNNNFFVKLVQQLNVASYVYRIILCACCLLHAILLKHRFDFN